MTGNEALKELYKEGEDVLGEKISSKTPTWYEDIKHYDNIGRCLMQITDDLESLEELEGLRKSYEAFKKFLEDILENDNDEDLTKIKEKIKEYLKNGV